MKKAAIQLSVNAIVILLIAIIFLSLGLAFITGMFSKTAVKFEELLSKEPEPPAANANTPVTISRESIISEPGDNEVVKVNIFNPTNKNWVFRDAVTLKEDLCGINNDGVCFIDVANSNCNNKDKDNDCKPEYDCTKNSELGEGIGCVIVKGNPKLFCPGEDTNCNCDVDGYGIGKDPDCDPTEGVRLKIECSEGLELEKLTNPKEIKSGTSTEFSALLKIGKKTEEGSYLCRVGVEGFIEESERYLKDIIIKIE